MVLVLQRSQVCQYCNFIIPLLRHFTILGQKNAQNMPRYYTVEQGKNMDQKRSDKAAELNLFFLNGIINPLFGGLAYNTSGHFAHCSYFSSTLYYATRKISARIIC